MNAPMKRPILAHIAHVLGGVPLKQPVSTALTQAAAAQKAAAGLTAPKQAQQTQLPSEVPPDALKVHKIMKPALLAVDGFKAIAVQQDDVRDAHQMYGLIGWATAMSENPYQTGDALTTTPTATLTSGTATQTVTATAGTFYQSMFLGMFFQGGADTQPSGTADVNFVWTASGDVNAAAQTTGTRTLRYRFSFDRLPQQVFGPDLPYHAVGLLAERMYDGVRRPLCARFGAVSGSYSNATSGGVDAGLQQQGFQTVCQNACFIATVASGGIPANSSMLFNLIRPGSDQLDFAARLFSWKERVIS